MGYGHQQGLRAAHDEKDVSKAGHKRATDCWNELLIGSYRILQRAAGIAATEARFEATERPPQGGDDA